MIVKLKTCTTGKTYWQNLCLKIIRDAIFSNMWAAIKRGHWGETCLFLKSSNRLGMS